MRPVDAATPEAWWDAAPDRGCTTAPGRTYHPRRSMRPGDPGYYTAGRTPPPSWPETDPAPVATTVDPRPEGAPVDPPAVLKLTRAAQAAGWPTRTGYSRGLLRTRSVGVYKDVEIIGVWAAERGETRWYAMYERTIGAATGWKWGAITVWSRGKPMISGLKITELYERLFRA